MTTEQNGHHLILGELTDLITGKILPDTHDERYRQALAQRLIGPCGFDRSEIQKNSDLIVTAGKKQAILRVDFIVTINNRACLIVKYAPGSLVSRWKSAVAMSRVIMPYQIPRIVVTNGKDADILDGATGELLNQGLDALPCRNELLAGMDDFPFDPIPEKTREMALRIVYAFEVDGACPCDTDICRLELGEDPGEISPP